MYDTAVSQSLVKQEKPTSKSAIIALFLGIVSLICVILASTLSGSVSIVAGITCIPMSILATILGAITTINLVKHRNSNGKSLAIAGLVCGSLALLAVIVVLIMFGLFILIGVAGFQIGGSIG